jgi:hypothetical protein
LTELAGDDVSQEHHGELRDEAVAEDRAGTLESRDA